MGCVESGRLRWFDPESGEALDTYQESVDRLAATDRRYVDAGQRYHDAEPHGEARDTERRYDEARRESEAQTAAWRKAEARIAELEAALRERGRDAGE